MDLMNIRKISVSGRLQDVSLDLRSGQITGLIGPNGAGKSTLLQAITGLLDHQGDILLEDVSLDDLDATARARAIALQPQFIDSAWALSVHDIVSMGRLPWGDFDQDIIHRVMQQANIEAFAERRVNQLSGGERARVWLARVLANQPRVLLVDEPVASLDIHYQQQVMQILQGYAREGHAVLIAIHDLSLAARYCDELCLLRDGGMLRSGTVADVIDPDLLATAFDVPVYVDLVTEPPVVMAR